jgi:DNA repair exonuclease SbcCD ATPase subunit
MCSTYIHLHIKAGGKAMIINHITLKNFGCIKFFNRAFGKGIFIFAGDNGNGKTTIFKAVVLALFDSYEGNLSDYVNWDAEEFDVNIDFEHMGYIYNVTVRQSLKSKTSEREVTDFHNNQIYTGQEAKDFLKRIFDVELIKAAMLSLEQQLDVITVKPSERRDYLKKIYDLEFKKQQMFFAEQLTTLATKTTEISTELALLRNRTYEDAEPPVLPMTETEYATVQDKYAESVERIGKLKAELERYKAIKKIISDLETEVTKYTADITEVEFQIIVKEKQIADLPAESNARAAKAKADIEKAENQLAELAGDDPVIQELETKIAGIVLERVGSFDSAAFSAIQIELAKIEQRIQALEGICPTCGQMKPKTPETETELSELKLGRSVLETKIIELKAESERIIKLQKENRENRERKTKLENEKRILVERNESRKREMGTILSGARAALDTEKSNLDRLTTAATTALAETRKLLETKKALKIDSETRLTTAKTETIINPSDELVIVQRNIVEEKARIDEYQRILTKREAIVRQREQMKKQKEEDANRVKILDVELQEIFHEVAEIENAAKILKNEFPVYVISHIVKDLEVSMNDFLRRVYGGKYTIKLEDKKNSLRMVYGPKNADAGSGLSSGYEKSIFSLAWKWALSRVQNNRTLMMDEVDSAASQKNSLIFYKTIGDSLKFFDQILIVSHKEQTQELLENEYNAEVLTFTDGVAI